MGWDISIRDPQTGQTLETEQPHALAGGTYQPDGTREAWLRVTYNYSLHYRDIWGADSLDHINGLTRDECLPLLEAAVAQLGTTTVPDYWASTPGNAGKALADLYFLLKLCPADAVVRVA